MTNKKMRSGSWYLRTARHVARRSTALHAAGAHCAHCSLTAKACRMKAVSWLIVETSFGSCYSQRRS